MALNGNLAYFQRRAAMIGPNTVRLIATILERAVVPEQVFRHCQGILGLVQSLPGRNSSKPPGARRTPARYLSRRQSFLRRSGLLRGSHANLRGVAYFGPESESV